MRGEFHKLGKFNDAQIDHFEKRVGTFHVWHRQEELPKYAALLNDIQASIKQRGQTSQDDIQRWMERAELFTQRARECHPVNFSYDLMQTLTDNQVNFIERRFASERRKNFSKYLENTPDERRQKRVESVVKWAGRIGFDFNDTQIQLLDDAFANQISLRRQYYRLVDRWARDLFTIARDQSAANYEQRMEMQINVLWTLLEKAHTSEWQANRENWQHFGIKFVNSLSYDQRTYASIWLSKMAKTINAISRDEPSFKITNNPSHGCLPAGT